LPKKNAALRFAEETPASFLAGKLRRQSVLPGKSPAKFFAGKNCGR